MKRFLLASGMILSLGMLAGCRGQDLTPPPPEEVPVHEPEPVAAALEGVIEPAGVSIYMEGTHKLRAENGESILLESELVDLNAYLDLRTLVKGMIRPTVEQGGAIMDVSEVAILEEEEPILLEPTEEPASSSSATVSSVPAAVVPPPPPPPPPPPASSSAPAVVTQSSSVAQSSVQSSVPPVQVASSSAAAGTDERVAIMAKAMVDASNFTQPFCSRQAGFCVPLHKSWYYQSFGATSSYLWHVEVSAEAVQSLGDGPLVVNLHSGALNASIPDGSVQETDGVAIGYRAWTGNRHFRISAPAELRTAVSYMTENLSVYQLETQGASSAAGATSASSVSS